MLKSVGTRQAAAATLRLIRCLINEQEYCLELSAVRSIGRTHQFGFQTHGEESADAPDTIGWVAAGAQKVPVFDLAQRLGLRDTTSEAQDGYVAIINAAQPFALRVDRVLGNLEIAPTDFTPLPHIIEPRSHKSLKGIVKLDDHWLLCIDAVHLRQPVPAALSDLPVPVHSSVTPTSVDKSARTNRQIILFTAAQQAEGGEVHPLVFGLSLAQVQEIAGLPALLPIPNAPKYVLGITNWRGLPVPIIDLRARLGMEGEPDVPTSLDPKSRLLIARAPRQRGDEGLVGFLIKPQVKAFALPIPYQRNQQRLALDPQLLMGIFDLEGTPLLIPDLDVMLTGRFAPQPTLAK